MEQLEKLQTVCCQSGKKNLKFFLIYHLLPLMNVMKEKEKAQTEAASADFIPIK